MISILLVNFRLLRLVILCNWTLVALCCCINIILTCFLSAIAQPQRHDRLSPIDWLPTEVAKMLRVKFMPLNKILGSQAETQLAALEMVPKGFRCDDEFKQETKVALDKTAIEA